MLIEFNLSDVSFSGKLLYNMYSKGNGAKLVDCADSAPL